MFWVVDSARGEIRRSHVNFRQGDLRRTLDEYQSEFMEKDFRLRKVAGSRKSEIFSDTDIELQKARDRDFVRWQLDRVKTCHYLAATVALPGRLKAGVSVHRTPDAGAFSKAERKHIEAMFGQFSQAVQLGMHHHELLQAAWWEGLQTQCSDAVFLLDERGRVIRHSGQAEPLMRLGHISIQADKLICREFGDSTRLRTIISRALDPEGALSGGMTIGRPDGLPPYRVVVAPLSRQRRYLAPFESAAIVRVIDTAEVSRVSTTAIQEMYGLTLAEVRLAAALVEGHSLASAAATFGVTIGTVRAQLKSVFEKTGVNRQQELVLRLSCCR
jgi:DNA-binding CsgD family transcriptional regulator